jgi:hypothetical protein
MNDADTEENIEVFDLNGKPILSQPVAGATTILPTQNLAAGMYMVRVGNRSGKFIKK